MCASCSLITIDDSSGAPPSQKEVEATRQTVQVIEKCRLPEIFQESRFMVPDSLHEMVRALQWASGPVYKLAQTGEDSDAAEVSFVPAHHTTIFWKKELSQLSFLL